MTKKADRLTHVQEIELTRALAKAEGKEYKRILDKLVVANFGLVNKIVGKFPLKNATCSHDDLFQEGVAGLIHGIQKFDPARGYRLSTYVYNWINVYVKRYFQNHGRTIRIPIHIAEKQYTLKKQIEELTEKLGRTPTLAEIHEVNGNSDTIMDVTRFQSSLNRSFGKDGDAEVLDTIASEDTQEEFDIRFDVDTLLAKVKGSISGRDYAIIISRYGLGDKAPLSLSEVAEQYDITRARVHQIEKKVLNKMKELATA